MSKPGKQVPALQSKKVDQLPKETVDQFLTRTFDSLLEKEGVGDLPARQYEGVIRAMRMANKIGYTNGFKKAAK